MHECRVRPQPRPPRPDELDRLVTGPPVAGHVVGDCHHATAADPVAAVDEHGGPVRLIVPQLYAWKSAKWIKGVHFLEHDQAGYWEEGGYHMRGNPWTSGDGERFRWS